MSLTRDLFYIDWSLILWSITWKTEYHLQHKLVNPIFGSLLPYKLSAFQLLFSFTPLSSHGSADPVSVWFIILYISNFILPNENNSPQNCTQFPCFLTILDCTVVKSVFIACINIPQDLDDRQSFKIDIIELSLWYGAIKHVQIYRNSSIIWHIRYIMGLNSH